MARREVALSARAPSMGINPDANALVVATAWRGARAQTLLRAVLVGFVLATIGWLPPDQGGAGYAVAAVYLVFAIVFGIRVWRGGPSTGRRAWLGLFVDLAVLTTLTLLTGVSAEYSWTPSVLLYGLFVIPILGSMQLRPEVCVAIVVPTTVVFAISSVATKSANQEPWASIVLRCIALGAVGGGAIALSRIQRSRVSTIEQLLRDRTDLLNDLVQLEHRERGELAQQLHDGALQYVLAARQDVDELSERRHGDSDSLARIDHALVESARLLRSKVAELHPAVLDHAGLPVALGHLAEANARPDRTVQLDTAGWPDSVRTSADVLLFGAARELLSNVVKHAAATSVELGVAFDGAHARLVVADDGRGVADGDPRRGLDQGHVGLYSQRLRIEAAGGELTVASRRPTGTVVSVELPAAPVDAIES